MIFGRPYIVSGLNKLGQIFKYSFSSKSLYCLTDKQTELLDKYHIKQNSNSMSAKTMYSMLPYIWNFALAATKGINKFVRNFVKTLTLLLLSPCWKSKFLSAAKIRHLNLSNPILFISLFVQGYNACKIGETKNHL